MSVLLTERKLTSVAEVVVKLLCLSQMSVLLTERKLTSVAEVVVFITNECTAY